MPDGENAPQSRIVLRNNLGTRLVLLAGGLMAVESLFMFASSRRRLRLLERASDRTTTEERDGAGRDQVGEPEVKVTSADSTLWFGRSRSRRSGTSDPPSVS